MVKLRKSLNKSTRASAPRITLPSPPSRIRSARISAKIASTSTRSNTEGHSITNSMILNIQPDVPTHVLTINVRGQVIPNSDMDKDHDEVRGVYNCIL
jgi:hypothetical protein